MDNIVTVTNDIENLNLSDSFICSPEQSSHYCHCGNDTLKILHLNIRSINCNFDALIALLSRIKSHLDIIILTECWLSKCPCLPLLQGYNSFSSDYESQNEGVVAYVRDNLICNVATTCVLDANCLMLKLENKLAIVALYRPPKTAPKNIDRFLNSLDDTLSQLNSFRSVAIIGDININIAPNSNVPGSEDYLNLLASHAMLPTHVLPTRLESCLDHVILKSPHLSTTLILDSLVTDHNPVLFCLAMSPETKPPKASKTKLDVPKIVKAIENTDFSPVLLLSCANKAAHIFVTIISLIVLKHTLTLNIPSKNRIIKPWITPGLLRCIRHRDRLYRKYKKNITNEFLKLTFTRYRTFCNNLLKKVKRDYERNELWKVRKNTKATWNLVKKIANLNRTKTSAEELLKVAPTPKMSVDTVNQFFANVGKDLAAKILPPKNIPSISTDSTISAHSHLTALDSMACLPVDCEEIEHIILNLKDGCAVGWDSIPVSVIKCARYTLIPIMNHIFNLCLSTGTFPSAFKKAIVHPIYKNGDKKNVTNYRPISVLSTISKIFEKLINKRLLSFLHDKKVLSERQFGFRIGRSTEDAVIELTTAVLGNIERKRKSVGIFLDLSKAFDTVSIPILLDKLQQIGVRGSVNNLFKSYLTNRTQVVVINDNVSDEEDVIFGVPQGSVLGPTLFLVYINDLCKLMLPKCHIYTYADDTALIISGESWDETKLLAESALRVVLGWLSSNLLTLNLDKTKFITFSANTQTQPKSFLINAHTCLPPNHSSSCCQTLKRTHSIKYLGVHLDSTLSWSAHIDSTVARVRKLMFVFRNLRSVADYSCLKTVYYSLAQSIINYCITAWGGSTVTQMIKVERAQRAVLKVMLSKPRRFSTSMLYSISEVPTVRQLFILATVLRKHSHLYFNADHVTNKRRSDIVCKIEPHRTTLASLHYHYLSPILYNKVNKILNLYPLPVFKCKSKCLTWLLSLSYERTESLLKIT